MLDLGFLEDVEKILSLTPNGRQTALFSATMPPEIRALAERHLYDPVTVKVKAATLTIDTVEQFYLETKPAGEDRRARRACSRPSGPSQAIVFVRTKIRCEQLYRTLRDKGMNVKALHGDMTPGRARRRDDLVQGRARADPRRHRRRRPRARHLDGHPHRQLRRPDVARRLRAPHRPHRPRRALGPRDHVRRAAPARATSRRSRSTPTRTISPWAEGAHVAPAPAAASRPRRHRKPHDADAPSTATATAKLIASGGRAAGLAEADLIPRSPRRPGSTARPMRNVRLLERFALLEVPGGRGRARGRGAVDGTEVRGHTLRARARRT